MYDLTVILPTLNEEESIRGTVYKIMEIFDSHHINGQIIVVDDDSTDKTQDILKDIYTSYENFEYIIRKSNHGLSHSLVEGFQAAEADIILVTDADGQHELEKIPELYRTIRDGYDIAVGSRYIEGGNIIGWPWYRKTMSWGATLLSRFFFPAVMDSGSGFFAMRKDVVKDAPLKPRGFRMAFEIIGKGNWKTIKEVPYTLNIRQNGTSKLKAGTVFSYLKQVGSLFKYSVRNRNSHGHAEIVRVIKFMAVGAFGIVVNLVTLYAMTEGLLTDGVKINYVVSSIAGVEASILTNFVLNETFTFRDIIKKELPAWKRFFSYHVFCFIGSAISVATLMILTEWAGIWYLLSGAIGMFMAFIWNFASNRGITWIESSEAN